MYEGEDSMLKKLLIEKEVEAIIFIERRSETN